MTYAICKRCNREAQRCGHKATKMNGARLVQYARRQLNMTQQDMADRLGVSKRTVQYLESGEKKLVPPESYAILYMLDTEHEPAST